MRTKTEFCSVPDRKHAVVEVVLFITAKIYSLKLVNFLILVTLLTEIGGLFRA